MTFEKLKGILDDIGFMDRRFVAMRRSFRAEEHVSFRFAKNLIDKTRRDQRDICAIEHRNPRKKARFDMIHRMLLGGDGR